LWKYRTVIRRLRHSEGAGKHIQIKEEGFMSMTAADVLVEVLVSWGVELIFGLPGDGINVATGLQLIDINEEQERKTAARTKGSRTLKNPSRRDYRALVE
jgi:hypothetical protein